MRHGISISVLVMIGIVTWSANSAALGQEHDVIAAGRSNTNATAPAVTGSMAEAAEL